MIPIPSNLAGTRSDLAAWLRANRRTYDLTPPERWQSGGVHTFCSRLKQKPFYVPGMGKLIQVGNTSCFGRRTRILDWDITPF